MEKLDLWDKNFALLSAFAKKHGHVDVERNYCTEGGFPLGVWVAGQRVRWHVLPKERREKLEALPGWQWVVPEGIDNEAWRLKFEDLCAYAKIHGHACVPLDFLAADGSRLGAWISEQREERWTMPVGRVEALESVPGWGWRDGDAKWNKHFAHLCDLVKKRGNTEVPENYYDADGFHFGRWVQKQRGQKDSLSKDRCAQLEALPGWRWNIKKERGAVGLDREVIGFALLQAYVAQFNSASVPFAYVTSDGFRLGQWVAKQRRTKDKISQERRAALEALPGWFWSIIADNDKRWHRKLDDLRACVEKNGPVNMPAHLAVWVCDQRAKRFVMPPERVKALESVPGWGWSDKDAKWNKHDANDKKWLLKLDDLRAYVEKNGPVNVPKHVRASDGSSLATWVCWQRARRLIMPPERVKALESVPGWSWDVYESTWNEKFTCLCNYVKAYGTTEVPRSYCDADGFQLGRWVQTQRGQKDFLFKERYAQLEALPGWRWKLIEDKWVIGFALLQAYVAKFNSTAVPFAYIAPDGFRLGHWVMRQRRSRDKISQERKAALEALPGWSWSVVSNVEKWHMKLDDLRAYVEKNGPVNVPIHVLASDGSFLATWVFEQRAKRSTMSPARVKALESVPGWSWDAYESTWNEKFACLCNFVKVHGTAEVPRSYCEADGFQLGRWVYTQRAKKDSFSGEQRAQFEALPGWRWDTVVDKWAIGFEHMQEFVAEFNTTKVPLNHVMPDGYLIGQWAKNQRSLKKTMSPERKAALESLPGWYWSTRSKD